MSTGRKEFPGIAKPVWIEDLSNTSHELYVVKRKQLVHELDLFDANTMFARDASAELDAFGKYLVARCDDSFGLFWNSFIEQKDRVHVAISGVKDVCDPYIMSFRDFANEA